MYTIRAYRKLPKEIKSIATKHYVSVACMRMNVSHHNHLYDFFELERSYNPQLPALPTPKGNFWTLKSGGEVIDRTHIIESMDMYLNGLSLSTLRHPVWQAVALKAGDTESAYTVLRFLNPKLSSMIFSEDKFSQTVQLKEISKELIEGISKHCSLDSVAALLVFSKQSDKDAGLFIESLIKSIITLSLLAPTDVIGFDLFKEILERYEIIGTSFAQYEKLKNRETFNQWIMLIERSIEHLLGKEINICTKLEIYLSLRSIALEELYKLAKEL